MREARSNPKLAQTEVRRSEASLALRAPDGPRGARRFRSSPPCFLAPVHHNRLSPTEPSPPLTAARFAPADAP
ncbi:MAG: hypothetical protein B6A08_08790 [Sorangiineae bacterium NIC37A_2]|nr:MAG: hypothetical protein B6A08_08790 [Sorangiineae bacterium NIC37A_2]